MKTTVIIPNYNGKEYLQSCLASLLQCIGAFDILVVDNGSTDGSDAMMKELFPKIRYIQMKENIGFAGAVNEGLNNTTTPYAILLNNDTTVAEDFVVKLEEAIAENPKIFSVSAKMVSMYNPEILDGAGDLYCALGWAFALGKGKPTAKYYTKPASVFSACGGAVIYNMEVMRQIGYFDENHFAYLEDTDIGYRARIYGYSNRYEPKAICFHAGSGFSGSRYNDFKISLSSKNSIYLIWKNMPLLQILINLPVLLCGFLIKILFFTKKGYGKTYCKGLCQGFGLSFSKQGREKKVEFHWKNLGHYIKIQILLWINVIRRIIG